jgi:hypothetical protein
VFDLSRKRERGAFRPEQAQQHKQKGRPKGRPSCF